MATVEPTVSIQAGRKAPSIFLETAALRVRTEVDGNIVLVGTARLLGAHAPEVGQARLIVRVAGECLAIDGHRLAVEMNAPRTVGRGGIRRIAHVDVGSIGHGCTLGKEASRGA